MSVLDRFKDGMGMEKMVIGLLSTVAHVGGGEAEAERVLRKLKDEYAHELAEKQRDMLRQGFRMEHWASVVNSLGQDEPLGTTHVIDHIDPEITEVRPARVALAELRDPEVLNSE